MNSLADTLSWPTRDPQWLSKILLVGLFWLLALLPVVGWVLAPMVFWGWLFATVDNLRAGRLELPSAGFGHLRRGLAPFGVVLVYTVGFTLPALVVAWAGLALASAGDGRGAGVLAGLGALLTFVGIALGVVLGVGYGLLQPIILLRTYHGGVRGGLDVAGILKEVSGRPADALLAGLFAYIAQFIGQLGVLACLVGQVLTYPYGLAVLAGVIAHYEGSLRGEAGTATPPGPSPQLTTN